MELSLPTWLEKPIYDGFLEPVEFDSTEEKLRSSQGLKIQLGRPEWWFASDILSKTWIPPQSDDIYLLVRLAFSIEPIKGYRAEEVRLTAYLHCSQKVDRQPIAFDLFPREVQEEIPVEVAITMGPSLKFDEIEGSLGAVGAEIPITMVKPVITTSGLGQTTPTWIFRRHRRHPLEGSRLVYVIIAYPSKSQKMRLSLELTAIVTDFFGTLPLLGLPSQERDNLSWTIP